MQNKNELVKGSIWILAGILLLLKTLDIISFSILKVLSYTWPLFIIGIGFAYFYKKKEFVKPIVSVLLLLFVFGLLDAIIASEHDKVEFSQEITLDELTDKLVVKLDFGVGSINISSTNDTLYSNSGFTGSSEPHLSHHKEFETTVIYSSRAENGFTIGHGISEEWNIELYDNVPIDIDMNYGVTDAYIDLSDLKVDSFKVESGVTDNEILFGAHPTKVFIESGVSDISLSFAEDYPVRIKLNSGMSSNHFDGFVKKDGYYTYKYNSSLNRGEFVDVRINSGVADVNIEVRK